MGAYEDLREQAAKEGYLEGNERMDEIAKKAKAEYLAKFQAQRAAKQQANSNTALRRQSENQSPQSPSATTSADECSGDALAKFQPRKERRNSSRTRRHEAFIRANDDSINSGNLFAAANVSQAVPSRPALSINPSRSDGAYMGDPIARSLNTGLAGRTKSNKVSSDTQFDSTASAAGRGFQPSARRTSNADPSIPTKRAYVPGPSTEQPRLSMNSFKIPKKESAASVHSPGTPQSD